MRRPAVATLMAAAMLAAVAAADSVNFDNLEAGVPPPGWTATKTASGEAKWTIEADSTAPSKPNVQKQAGQATYPVCIKDDTNLKDGFVSSHPLRDARACQPRPPQALRHRAVASRSRRWPRSTGS